MDGTKWMQVCKGKEIRMKELEMLDKESRKRLVLESLGGFKNKISFCYLEDDSLGILIKI